MPGGTSVGPPIPRFDGESVMNRSHKALGFLLVALVGAWGCSKAPSGAAASAEKNPSLEAKVKRLDEDFRAAAAARDQFRQKLLAAEERLTAAENRAAQLQVQADQARAGLSSTTAERDSLKADLAARTNERDNLASQYDSFRKNIKNLLGQAETSLNSPTNPVSPASPPPPAPGK
jgi:chromosome segregation ATPase